MTSTPSFGSGRRESHDASGFYGRFDAPAQTNVKLKELPPPLELPEPWLICGDSRKMASIPDSTVALVVTSPPYFAGKDYEATPGAPEGGGDGSPVTWGEYLEMLAEVFAECHRVLEPGGRIAINVANLGRRPYRSLSGEVTRLVEQLGFLLRAEHVWIKAEGARGSCAFGSWLSPANPTIRDVTERIVVASKAQMGRVGDVKERTAAGRPCQATLTKEEFLSWTLDSWRMRPESAKRIGHPAPFPVELPERLIKLHTFAGEVVLDPFCGSGTTGVAAARTGRGFIGYDLDDAYLDLAKERLAAETGRAAA